MIGCLIIHGFTGGPYEVGPLKTYLEEHTDWKVEVPVLTGHGDELDLADVPYEVWLEDAEQAYERLANICDTIYVVGFSMGGMIAAYLAGKHPIDKLVLLSTARKYISFKYLSYYVGKMIGDSFKGKLHENDIFLHYKGKIGQVPFRSNIEFMKLVRATKGYLEDVQSPVLIAQGQKDGLVPMKTAYALEEEIGSDDKQVVFFEESDHLICLGDNAPVLVQMIYEFLSEIERENVEPGI